MSAFIVSNKHINYLLTYANRECVSVWISERGTEPGYILDFGQVEHLQRAAQMMMDENYRSVNYRYQESDEPEAITFEFVSNVPLTHMQALKAAQCLNYQCCETPDFDETPTKRIIDYIESHAISKLPGYSQAAWEIR